MARTMGKPPELPRGRPGPKYDVRPSARECEPHKRINQKEDPSDFEDKYDPNQRLRVIRVAPTGIKASPNVR